MSSSQQKRKMLKISLQYSYWEVCQMYHYYSCNSLWPTNKKQPGILQPRRTCLLVRLKSVTKSTRCSVASLCDPGARFSKAPITFQSLKAVLCFSRISTQVKFQQFWKWFNEFIRQQSKPPVCELFNRFWFQNSPLDPKSYQAFLEHTPVLYSEGPQ